MVWQIKRTETEQVDRFSITKEEVIVPNGDTRNFSYIQFSKGVCILPVTAKGEVLCLKQYRHIFNDWEWELPAGSIDGEDEPLETAKRELEEETGYQAAHWMDLGSFYPSPGSTAEEIHLFAAAGLTKTEQKLESSEQIELHSLPMTELKDLVANGEFKHGAGLAAIIRYKFKTD
ncbi:MAG: NUDIX hydrolase [Bacillus sp. (in: firmicutes)]